jgi:hypothetical protein
MIKIKSLEKNDMLSDPLFYTEEIGRASERIWSFIKPEIDFHKNIFHRGTE